MKQTAKKKRSAEREEASPVLPARILMLDTESLLPSAQNARTHSPEQVTMLAESIKTFGFTNPVLIASESEPTITAGHGRVLAAKVLGMKTVPCIELSHLNEKQRAAYMLADNQLPMRAGWDRDMLAVQLEAVIGDGFDAEWLLGFAKQEINDLIGTPNPPPLPGDAETMNLRPGTFSVVVDDLESEQRQRDLIQRLESEGYQCRALML
jgi:hypothetical protein